MPIFLGRSYRCSYSLRRCQHFSNKKVPDRYVEEPKTGKWKRLTKPSDGRKLTPVMLLKLKGTKLEFYISIDPLPFAQMYRMLSFLAEIEFLFGDILDKLFLDWLLIISRVKELWPWRPTLMFHAIEMVSTCDKWQFYLLLWRRIFGETSKTMRKIQNNGP